MEKQIDKLIELHKEGYTKYTLLCSIKDFKQLQILMSKKYHIKEYDSMNSTWSYSFTNPNMERIGTIRFKNFELNVTCPSKYNGDVVIEKVYTVDSKFKNSKKE